MPTLPPSLPVQPTIPPSQKSPMLGLMIALVVLLLLSLAGIAAIYLQAAQNLELSRTEMRAATEKLETLEKGVTEKIADATRQAEAAKPAFASLLYKKEFFDIPFGAAEIEGYYTTVERATSLDDSTPQATCSAFVITNGPQELLNAFTNKTFGSPPTVVIGPKNMLLDGINTGTKEKPTKALVTLNASFEGELIGCMSWPFDSIVALK